MLGARGATSGSRRGGVEPGRVWGIFSQPGTRAVRDFLGRLPATVRPVPMIDFDATARVKREPPCSGGGLVFEESCRIGVRLPCRSDRAPLPFSLPEFGDVGLPKSNKVGIPVLLSQT